MPEPSLTPPDLPHIRGTQIGLHSPAQIDQIKADMVAGTFAYAEVRAQVTGLRDPRGVLHVLIGHHRIVAALELFKETGNDLYLRELLRWARFDDIEYTPHESRPLPARDWWGAFRHWLGI